MLQNKAVLTAITTRSQYNTTDWITTQDKVFLLSEADLFGTFNKTKTSDAQDYTYGNSVIVPNINMRKSSNICWLRSARGNASGEAVVQSDGTALSYGCTAFRGIRPALWVDYVS